MELSGGVALLGIAEGGDEEPQAARLTDATMATTKGLTMMRMRPRSQDCSTRSGQTTYDGGAIARNHDDSRVKAPCVIDACGTTHRDPLTCSARNAPASYRREGPDRQRPQLPLGALSRPWLSGHRPDLQPPHEHP